MKYHQWKDSVSIMVSDPAGVLSLKFCNASPVLGTEANRHSSYSSERAVSELSCDSLLSYFHLYQRHYNRP